METVVMLMREANVVLGSIGFFWVLFKVNNHWENYDLPFRAYSMALILFVFATVYSSAENLAQATEPGLRSIFVFVANVALLFALWLMRGRHTVSKSKRLR